LNTADTGQSIVIDSGEIEEVIVVNKNKLYEGENFMSYISYCGLKCYK